MKTLVILLALTSIASAQSMESKAFWRSYDTILEKQVLRLPKGIPVEVELRDRTVIYGTYDGFTKYSETIWVDTGRLFDEGFNIGKVLDIRMAEKV
jgi:hypothetical protein